MAHFAELDSDNKVIRVLVVANEHEQRGQEYLADDCGLGGTWKQTSYNGNIRGKYAGVGDIYDEVNDEFYTPVSEVALVAEIIDAELVQAEIEAPVEK